MPILENPRHEKFCQFRALGKTQDEAYAEAGYKPARQHAHRLATKGYIIDRIRELQAGTVERYEVTAESLSRELDKAIAFAVECKQPSAYVAAIVAKAKLFGLFVDQHAVNVTHNYSLMTEEEIRFEMAAIHAEARQIKAGVQN